MKKFIVLFGALIASSMLLAEVQQIYVGENLTKRKTLLENKINEETTASKKAFYTFLLNILSADVKSFTDLQNLQKSSYEKFSLNYEDFKKWMDPELVNYLFAYKYSTSLKKEAYDYFKANKDYKSSYRFINDQKRRSEMNISDNEIYFIVKNYLLNQSFNNKEIDSLTKALGLFLEYANKVADDTDTKDTLKKLNRIYSQKLIEDKTTWEPIVAKIRTAIDTY